MSPVIGMIEKKDKFEDDGRTICPMDVERMPESVFRLSRSGKSEETSDRSSGRADRITRAEARRYTWYAVLAGLTVAGTVGGGTVLFILILWLLWR